MTANKYLFIFNYFMFLSILYNARVYEPLRLPAWHGLIRGRQARLTWLGLAEAGPLPVTCLPALLRHSFAKAMQAGWLYTLLGVVHFTISP
jgi:hypothetical protein